MSSEDLSNLQAREKPTRQARRQAAMGDPDSALFNMFYGPSHYGSTDMVKINEDVLAYVFITKPNLNLRDGNVLRVRKLQYLLDPAPNSQANAVKCSLARPNGRGSSEPCPAVNDKYPFIPFLSSSLESVSGWPDEAMEFFETEEGWAKEVVGWADGRPESFSTFDLQFTFNSKEGDPHSAFFTAYFQYMGHVGIGTIPPLEKSENEFEIDYAQNVYIVLTDRTKSYIQKVACLNMGGFWQGTNNGAAFNVEKGPTIQLTGRQISVPMRCFGFLYNDPAIFERFNKLMGMFNPDMRRLIYEGDAGRMIKIPKKWKQYFNHRGYPLMNPSSTELEWWIEKDMFLDILAQNGIIPDGEV